MRINNLKARADKLPPIKAKALQRVLILAFFAALSVLSAQAKTCQVVTPTGSGNKSGTDWNNSMAWSAAPVLTRGTIYYFASGRYPSPTLNDADSGTLTITLRSAIAADQCTATGWNSGTMAADIAGPVVFDNNLSHTFLITTDWYVLDGQVRGAFANGGWETGYGMKIDNSVWSKSQTLGGSPTAFEMGSTDNHTPASHNIIQYVEVVGSGDKTHTYCDRGIEQGQLGDSDKYQYDFVHDTGSVPVLVDGNVGSWIWQYGEVARDQSFPACHAEGFALRTSATPMNGVVVAESVFKDIVYGTAQIGTPNSSNAHGCSDKWSIDGNLFYHTPAGGSGAGDGVLSFFSSMCITGTLSFSNNTMVNLPIGSIHTDSSIAIGHVIVQNNLWYNDNGTGNSNTAMAGVTTLTWDHNGYFGTTTNSSDLDPNKQTSASNPFVGATSFDFRLVSDTQPGVLTPFSLDINNIARGANGVWDRGAFQIPGNRPSPPVGLAAVVN